MTETISTPTAAEPKQAPGRHWLDLANETDDPLQCLAMALTGLLEVAVVAGEDEAQADDQSALVTQLDTELQEALGERDGTIAAVRAALGKSTSQVAEKVRAALGDTPAKDESSAPAPSSDTGEATRLEQPERDSPLEQWRVYAGQEGFSWNETEGMNRSQIRTLLGIPNA